MVETFPENRVSLPCTINPPYTKPYPEFDETFDAKDTYSVGSLLEVHFRRTGQTFLLSTHKGLGFSKKKSRQFFTVFNIQRRKSGKPKKMKENLKETEENLKHWSIRASIFLRTRQVEREIFVETRLVLKDRRRPIGIRREGPSDWRELTYDGPASAERSTFPSSGRERGRK